MEEWEADIREELQCEREKQNAKDPYTVAVVHEHVVDRHPFMLFLSGGLHVVRNSPFHNYAN